MLKEKRQDGTIVATSKTTSNQETSGSVTKIKKECVGQGSAKEGLKLMNGHVNGTLKSTDSGDVLLADNSSKSGDNDIQLVRKQNRKRGKRKKT